MVAAMAASGVITMLVDRFSPYRVMGVSMIMWSLGVGLTGASQGFWFLLFVRLLAGTGTNPHPCVNTVGYSQIPIQHPLRSHTRTHTHTHTFGYLHQEYTGDVLTA